jgi:hypothetical protein
MPRVRDKLRATLAPLGKREARRAIAAARSELESSLEASAAERLRVLGAELVVRKPSRGTIPVRLVDVVIRDGARQRNVSVLVGGNERVVAVEELEFQPDIQPDEIEEAREIAERDRRVSAVARRRGAFVSVFVPAGHDGAKARLVGLRYAALARRETVAHVASAVVDMSAGELVSFERVAREEKR